MRATISFAFLLGVLILASGIGTHAAQSTPEPVREVKEPTEVLERWGRELDSDDFRVREEASRRLSNAGPQAIPILNRIASGDSLEAATRALDVLKRQFQSENEATRLAAHEALKKLAKSSNNTIARKALAAIAPPIPPDNTHPWRKEIEKHIGNPRMQDCNNCHKPRNPQP